MNLEIQNDLKKFRRYYDMFDHLENIQFQTDVGKETAEQIKGAINEIIKPYLVNQGNKLKDE